MGKKKAAWRKAKIEDVEDDLEDTRLVNKLKRKGTSKQEQADLHELFTVDTSGSGQGLSARTRREIARAKLFPPKGPNIGLSASEEAKIERAERQLEASKAPKAPQEPEVFDLWSGKTQAQLLKEEKVGSTVRLVPQPKPVSTPKTVGEKVSTAPAVVPAHEGQSINPSATAYEEIACVAAAKELEREQEEEALNRRNKPMTYELRDAFGEEAVREMDEETKVRMYRSLKCRAPAEEDAGADAEGCVGKAVKVKQKSQAKRNREKVRRKVEVRQKQFMDQRKLEKSVGSLGTIMKELDEQAEYFKERAEYRKALKRKRRDLERSGGELGKTRRIGRGRFAEDTVAVPEADAVGKGGLRSMSVKGCAVKERLSSIVRRGMTIPLPAATQPEYARRKKGIAKQARKRKLVSPLLKDSLMLS